MNRIERFLAVCAVASLAPLAALAQQRGAPESPPPITAKSFNERVAQAAAEQQPGGPVAVGQTVAHVAPGGGVAIVQAPPAAVIDSGSYAGQAVMWVFTTFGVVVGGALTRLLLLMAKKAGVQGAEVFSAQLNALVVRALHAGAVYAAENLRGKGQIEVKNAIVAQAVKYTQEHGATLIKALGDDPNSQKAIEGIKARIATVVADPAEPTPKELDSSVTRQAPAG